MSTIARLPKALSAAGPSVLPMIDTQAVPAKMSVVLPTIVISPPDEQPSYSLMAPEQFYDKTVLFVPVKTEELGWDEHGLYWNGTYAYPIHNIYNKQGRAIGRRRKGPAGYRFEEYFENNKVRSVPQTPDQVDMIESEILDPFMAVEAEAVEEARVNLTEPAPARTGSSELTVAHTVTTGTACANSPNTSSDDPISPTLSVTSDTNDSETSSLCCGDDSSSLWSRCDSLSDGETSASTSPGTLSPPDAPNAEAQAIKADTLSEKLEQVASASDSFPSRLLSTSDLTSDTPKAVLTPVQEQSSDRVRSSLIAPADRLSKSRKADTSYSSLIHELSTSPFSANAPSLSTISRSKTTRSRSSISTMPRSSASIFRSSSLSQATRPRPAPAARRNLDLDFAGGWQFENESRQLSSSWQQTFLDDE